MMKPELLAPAGNMEKLKTALQYGADAVYCAGKEFGLRAHAGNFTDEELAEAVRYTHDLKKKIYITVNVFALNRDIGPLKDYISFLGRLGVDGVMVSDPGVISLFNELAPDIPLALSTQANCTNTASALFWKRNRLSRIVLARELSLDEISEITAQSKMETEVFIHGAICISWSGRCFISRYLTGRGANRGDCTHSCRWGYSLVEDERPDQYLPIEEDSRGSYIFNARDICLLSHIPNLIKAGVCSFKIEGRMKSVSYVASTTAVYRDAIDSFLSDGNAVLKPEWKRELDIVSTRELTEGFIRGSELPDDYIKRDKNGNTGREFCGITGETTDGSTQIYVRNRICAGDNLEFFSPGLNIRQAETDTFYSENRKEWTDTVHPNDICRISLPFSPEPGTIVRRIESEQTGLSTF